MNLHNLFKILSISVILSACAIGVPEPGAISDSEKAKKFTDVGIAYLKSGDSVSALNWLQNAIGYDESYARAYSILGTVFQTDKEYDLAEKYFKKSVELDSESAMFHNNYGVFLFQQKRYGEACNELELATQDPFYNSRASALNNLGRCYEALDQEEKASQAYQKSINLGGRNPSALLSLTRQLLSEGEIFQSNKKYSEFLDMVSENKAEHSAKSLILGIDLARESGNTADVATYSLLLENLFPTEYTQYKESAK